MKVTAGDVLSFTAAALILALPTGNRIEKRIRISSKVFSAFPPRTRRLSDAQEQRSFLKGFSVLSFVPLCLYVKQPPSIVYPAFTPDESHRRRRPQLRR